MNLPDTSSSISAEQDRLSFVVKNSFEGLDELRSAWDEAVVRLGGSIYMSYDWCRIWWKFYGKGKDLRLFIFRSGDEVVGIAPLYLDSLGCWPFRFKVARLVGANIPPKVFDPPMDEALAERMFERILHQLFENDHCDLFSFGPVSESHKPTGKLPGACTSGMVPVAKTRVMSNGVHTVFSLPASMDEYFASLGKNERKKRQYELRLLRKECEVSVDVLSDPSAVGEEFERFVGQHTAQWSAEGKPGHFGAWPRAKEFNESLVKAHGTLGRIRFVRIWANGELVSNQYVFSFGSAYFWELPARAMGREWDRLSLGPAGAITMIETAIREGKTRVEGGLGHYDYKLKLGAKEHALKTVRVAADRGGSRIRMMVSNAIRLCLLYGYHKIWYRRITPHLPVAFRRPQWNLWLRFDF